MRGLSQDFIAKTSMHPFTAAFVVAALGTTALKLWLAQRHLHTIRAHRDQVPAEFAQSISLDAHRKAADYSCAKTRLARAHTALDAALLFALTLGGGLNGLAGLADHAFSSELLQNLALIAMVVVISALIELPLGLYRTFAIEARFGFNQMTPRLYALDLAKQAALAAALGLPLAWAVLWLMAQMGSHWWLYVWLTWLTFNLGVLMIYPRFIAPLFNRFTPLADSALKTRIEALLQKCGYEAEGLFVMDGSKRTSHGNAFFTGFGRSKRIIFFDTLLAHLTPDEVEAVLAHEIGHFKRHHIPKRLVGVFSLSLVLLWALGRVMGQEWFYQGLGVTAHGTAMALILFFLVIPVFTFPLQPWLSHYSRKQEFEADQYAAQHTRPETLVQALVRLYRDNATTLTPDAWHSAFYDSHPPAAQRIARLQNAPNHG